MISPTSVQDFPDIWVLVWAPLFWASTLLFAHSDRPTSPWCDCPSPFSQDSLAKLHAVTWAIPVWRSWEGLGCPRPLHLLVPSSELLLSSSCLADSLTPRDKYESSTLCLIISLCHDNYLWTYWCILIILFAFWFPFWSASIPKVNCWIQYSCCLL